MLILTTRAIIHFTTSYNHAITIIFFFKVYTLDMIVYSNSTINHGPGTKYEQRNREGYRGINELDGVCKLHDKFYNENTDTKTRNISDIALAHRADEVARNPMYDAVQRKDANFISGIMKTKAKLGLGVESQSK